MRRCARGDIWGEEFLKAYESVVDRVAMRVAERLPLVGNFDGMTANEARTLARRYGLDFLVTESALPLPLAYQRAPLNVYRLR